MQRRRRGSEGQVLVIVAVGMVAFVALVGLVLDGGSTFFQRRDEQKGADLAALAGANDYLLNNDVAHAQSIAQTVASQNGWDPATFTVNVSVTPFHIAGGSVTVDVSAPHHNSFSSMLGMERWDVSVTATAVAGQVTGSSAPGPFLVSYNDFQANGQPAPAYTQSGCPNGGCQFGTVNGDAPNSQTDLAWTNYGNGNVDTNQVDQIITGQWVPTNTIVPNQYIGQYNNGFHNALFQDINTYLAGTDVLVPVVTQQVPGVDDGPFSCGSPSGTPAGGGCFQGWAIFHVVQAVGGSDKHIYGYFVSQKFVPGGTVTDCDPAVTVCPRTFGAYSLQLVN